MVTTVFQIKMKDAVKLFISPYRATENKQVILFHKHKLIWLSEILMLVEM